MLTRSWRRSLSNRTTVCAWGAWSRFPTTQRHRTLPTTTTRRAPQARRPNARLPRGRVGSERGRVPVGSGPTYDLWGTQALARTMVQRTQPTYTYYVRLRHGAADINRFDQEAEAAKPVPGFNGASSRGRSGGLGYLVGPSSSAGLVGAGCTGRSRGPSRNRPSAVPAEQRRKGGLPHDGGDRRRPPPAGKPGPGPGAGCRRHRCRGRCRAGHRSLRAFAPLGEARTAEVSTGVHFDVLVLPLGRSHYGPGRACPWRLARCARLAQPVVGQPGELRSPVADSGSARGGRCSAERCHRGQPRARGARAAGRPCRCAAPFLERCSR